jgi:hypothetical protein
MNRGDIVIDPFLGSGSTLIAVDKAGRVCRGVELDPLYIDVIVRRYEAATRAPAVLIETSETFEALAARGALEQANIQDDDTLDLPGCDTVLPGFESARQSRTGL